MPLFTTHSFRPANDIRGHRARMGLALAGTVLAVTALAGCAPEAGTPTSTPKASSTAVPSKEPTPSSTPGSTPEESATPAPTPTAEGTPVALECDQVLTPDDVYLFNINFGTAPSYEPTNDSAAETALSYEGLACGWSNHTSGELIEVSVVQPNEVLMTQLKDAAIEDSNPVPTYGAPPAVEGFFTNAGGPGEAQVFTPKYWVTVTSPLFIEPGDVQQLVSTVVSHLP